MKTLQYVGNNWIFLCDDKHVDKCLENLLDGLVRAAVAPPPP